MANEIKYNTEEINETQTILKESLNILQNEISTPLNSEFEALSKVDLFSSGLTKLKSQTETLVENYTTFSSSLSQHENDLSTFEDTQASEVREYISNYSSSGHYSSGSSHDTDSISTDNVEEGNAINNSYLETILPEISYNSKVQALKNILTYNNDTLTALLTDVSKANILVYQLKKMLNGQDLKISQLATDDEKKIQKIMLETLSKESNNPFAELDDSTFLKGMPYLTKIAKENNITVGDLILEDKYSSILMSSLINIYNGNVNNSLTEKEISGVKSYLDQIATINNLNIKTLFSDVKNITLIKGGIKNAVKS